jgi:D-alanine--D-alanine ligase
MPQPSSHELVERLGLPLFAKPNAGGSSVATSRVDTEAELEQAIREAFTECDEVLLERFIAGVEVTCGCYEAGGALHPLPVTEVVPKGTFFDFDAKYNGAVEEITPARISPEATALIQQLTSEIYRHIDARGIIRVDYIIEADGLPTLLEVNTTPGMTPTSFIPQQVAAAGLTMPQVLTSIIRERLPQA